MTGGPGRSLRPTTVGGTVYVGLTTLSVIGLVLITLGPWRRGVLLIGAGLVAAAIARATLGERESGMLRVRGRLFDAGVMAVVGVVLIVLAAVIPNQPGA